MEAVVGLMLMLLRISHASAVETHCDGRQDGAQCYGAVGGAVVLQLMDNASDIFRFQLVFNTTERILDVRENKIVYNLIESRSIFTLSNGTFQIDDLNRSDGGEYSLIMFDSQGKTLRQRTLQLFIQDPVSSVRLDHDCLSQGELKVSCLSEGGDSPEYSWTLDGRTLTDDKLLSGNNQNNTIILKQNVSGLLTCSVKNNVSRVSDVEQISTCGFIHIDCDINGTHISQWVYADNNTLCIESTTQTTATEMDPFYVAVETHCDGRQDGAQCYGAVGGAVVLQLMDNASDIFKFRLVFNTTQIILNVKENRILSNLIENRSIFTPSDGTYRINDLSKSDGGEYTLEMFDSQGQKTDRRTLQLFIQAPLSSVAVVTNCLPQGELKAFCESEGGDSPEYSWTLDGHTLTDDKLLSGNNQNDIIVLKQNVSGLLNCSVKNNFSRVSDVVEISTCVSAVETHCDGRQDGAQCYGALGGTLVLQLLDSASDIFRFLLAFNRTIILSGKENKISVNRLENRSVFTPSDGTFRINDLSRSDGGEYSLEMFNSQGQKTDKLTLQLFIQDPVSSVLLVTNCLSQGEVKVSCLSEGGDSPEYSWTLDGHTLTDDKLLPGNNQANTIILKQNVLGLLTCSVKNNVSHVSDEDPISTCGFIHIECYINGTHISKWVYAANNTLCITSPTTKGPHTTVSKETKNTVSGKSFSNFTSIIQQQSSTDRSLLICGLMFAVATLSVGGIFLFFHLKKRKYEKTKVPVTPRAMDYSENSFSVIELRG